MIDTLITVTILLIFVVIMIITVSRLYIPRK